MTIEQLTGRQILEYGPNLESTRISAGLDYYKPCMSQMAYDFEPDALVTFTFHNRGSERLADYVDSDRLQARFDQIRANGFSSDELEYLASLKNSEGKQLFKNGYLDYLASNELPPVKVSLDDSSGEVYFETSGNWPLVTFWETLVMSEVNEAYLEGYMLAQGINPMDLYDEGDRRLSEKIDVLRANPQIKFADFGTRRHFSMRWHKHVLDRLSRECPNYVGTSNVFMSSILRTKPVGTFAHEMPMVYGGLADIRGQSIRRSHGRFLGDWYEEYGADSAIALTDTFGTDFFLSDFSAEQAKVWRGLRQDSGDPYAFGEKAIAFYESQGIDPKSKTIIFSDGLDLETILSLEKHFAGRVNVLFGWGTTLTNDLGIKPLNVVMKATKVYDPLLAKQAETVKLSDDAGKHTGSEEKVKFYEKVFGVENDGEL